MSKNKEGTILDEEVGLGTHISARDNSEDIFDTWKREEYLEENHTSEGIYLGDGVRV